MSSAEGLDIRAPIGGLFSVLGVMLAFGVMMLLLARRAMARP